MIIVSGHLTVRPADRDAYLGTCVAVVEAGREAAGCLDFALSADLLDPGRINVQERWESRETLEAFRGDGVGDEQGAMIVGASVVEMDGDAHILT